MVVGLLRNSEIGMQTRNRLILLEAVAVVRVLQTPRAGLKHFLLGAFEEGERSAMLARTSTKNNK